MATRKATPRKLGWSLPPVPETLRLWGEVAAWRESYVETATRRDPTEEECAALLDADGRGALSALPDSTQAAAMKAIRKEYRALRAHFRDEARAELDQIDRDIRRAEKSPAALRRLAQASRDWRIRFALAVVEEYVKQRTSEVRGMIAREALGRLKAPQTDGAEIDLNELYENASAWRVARNRTHAYVARKMVADIAGISADARVLR